MLERRKEEKEEGGAEGLDCCPRQRVAMESKWDITDVKMEIKTDKEREFVSAR